VADGSGDRQQFAGGEAHLETKGVEGEATEAMGLPVAPILAGISVVAIAEDRMAQVLEVPAGLVHAAGEELHLDEAAARDLRDEEGTDPGAGVEEGAGLGLDGMVDLGSFAEPPTDERDVDLPGGFLLERGLERSHVFPGPGEQDHSARAPVEAMEGEHPVSETLTELLSQGALAGAGEIRVVNEAPRRLVGDDEVRPLEQQGVVFEREGGWAHGGLESGGSECLFRVEFRVPV